jgi:HEAT repeat protein
MGCGLGNEGEDNTMRHIFISYNHDDGDFAEILSRRFAKVGLDTWMDTDRLRAGEDWRAEIDQAIKEAAALIVVMTPKAKESEYITYEWAFALGAGVRVTPILLKPTELHPRLEALQYLDFTNRMARPWDKLIEALQKAETHALHVARVPPDVPPEIKRVIIGAVAALDSASPAERKAAIETLAQTDHPAAREALAKAVQHPVRDVRIHAAFALVPFKDARAVPGLIEALCDEDESMRAIAAAVLGHIGDAAAVPNLIDALRDKEDIVGEAAAEALGLIGDAAAVQGLLDALHDEGIDMFVHVAVAEALEEIGTPEALAAIEEWDARRRPKTDRPIDTIGPGALEPKIY